MKKIHKKPDANCLIPIRTRLKHQPSPISPVEEQQINKHFKLFHVINRNNTTKESLHTRPVSTRSNRFHSTEKNLTLNFLNLKQKQQDLKNYFSSVSARQKKIVTRLTAEKNKIPHPESGQKNSFDQRYAPENQKFYHKLIGTIKLPRKFIKIKPSESDKALSRVLSYKSPNILHLTKPAPSNAIQKLQKINFFSKPGMIRKVLSSSSHYKILKLSLLPLRKVLECFPGVPYGLPMSKKFIKACKEGDCEAVSSFLESNEWLVHSFDYSGQSGLHWVVLRGCYKVLEILLRHNAYIDSTDTVNYR
jgi:hypothetical protein